VIYREEAALADVGENVAAINASGATRRSDFLRSVVVIPQVWP